MTALRPHFGRTDQHCLHSEADSSTWERWWWVSDLVWGVQANRTLIYEQSGKLVLSSGLSPIRALEPKRSQVQLALGGISANEH